MKVIRLRKGRWKLVLQDKLGNSTTSAKTGQNSRTLPSKPELLKKLANLESCARENQVTPLQDYNVGYLKVRNEIYPKCPHTGTPQYHK